MLTQERAKHLFCLDEVAGILYWRERPQSDFRTYAAFRSFQSRCAGRPVGYIDDQGYRSSLIDRKCEGVHRLIWLYLYGFMPTNIDHIDGDRRNNRPDNLREVTTLENAKNQAIDKRNTSGVTGVIWNKKSGKWQANIRVQGRLLYLGLHTEVASAAVVIMEARERYGFHQNHGSHSKFQYGKGARV